MKPLQDDDRITFGTHKGERLIDVPASYFHWLWCNGMREDQQSPIADYIRRNKGALELESKNLIWE